MKIKEMPKEELELLGYDDIAYLFLKEENTKMKINVLFKHICDLLGLTELEFENRIADFFEILTTDKRFTLLSDGYWDLKEKHSEKVVIDEDDDEVFIDDATDSEPESEDAEIFYEEDDDDSDDDLKDLVVIDEDEENESI